MYKQQLSAHRKAAAIPEPCSTTRTHAELRCAASCTFIVPPAAPTTHLAPCNPNNTSLAPLTQPSSTSYLVGSEQPVLVGLWGVQHTVGGGNNGAGEATEVNLLAVPAERHTRTHTYTHVHRHMRATTAHDKATQRVSRAKTCRPPPGKPHARHIRAHNPSPQRRNTPQLPIKRTHASSALPASPSSAAPSPSLSHTAPLPPSHNTTQHNKQAVPTMRRRSVP